MVKEYWHNVKKSTAVTCKGVHWIVVRFMRTVNLGYKDLRYKNTHL
jgi:hypothetical protein